MNQNITRMTIVTLAASSLLAFVPTSPASAHDRANVYSSEDLYLSTRKINDKRTLLLMMRGPYFDTFRICVTRPSEDRACKRFPVGDSGGEVWGNDPVWRKHFPHQGAGAYAVTWHALGQRIGKKLGFHVR